MSEADAAQSELVVWARQILASGDGDKTAVVGSPDDPFRPRLVGDNHFRPTAFWRTGSETSRVIGVLVLGGLSTPPPLGLGAVEAFGWSLAQGTTTET